MPGYLVGSVKILDAERMARYAADAAPIVAQFGGRRLGGGPVDVVEGTWPWSVGYVFEFPSKEMALAFWNCDAYRALIVGRAGAVESEAAIFGD